MSFAITVGAGLLQTFSMKRYSITSLILALAAFVVIAFPQQLSGNGRVAAQKRRVGRPGKTQAIKKGAIDYSRFSHATPKHRGACNTCHQVPTSNWKKVSNFPDVADFPGHNDCVGCHRQQFFKGAKPVICSICHSRVSPRDDARFSFRNPASPGQFLIEFPHDRHQDVIARMLRRGPIAEQSLFVRASFTTVAAGETKHYNNCEICHGPLTIAPVAPAAGWPDSFVPDAATFKNAPASHAACFNCHWKAQQPTNENCAGCHKLPDKPAAIPVLHDVHLRISLKFRHAREQHLAECTACHINITKSPTLRGLKPDVPITACTECHNKDGLRLDLNKELEALDNNRDFSCAYCHTSDVGRRNPPPGHYLIAGREPIKRRDVK